MGKKILENRKWAYIFGDNLKMKSDVCVACNIWKWVVSSTRTLIAWNLKNTSFDLYS